MWKRKIIFRTLLAIAVLIVLLFLFLIGSVFIPRKQYDLQKLLPDKIEWSVSINSHQITKTLFQYFSINFFSKNFELNPFQFEIKDLEGINLNKEMVFFKDQREGIQVNGLLFHTASLRRINQLENTENNVIKVANKDVGVLFSFKNEVSKEVKAYYWDFAKSIISADLVSLVHSKEILTFFYRSKSDPRIQDLEIEVFLENEKIRLNGKGILKAIEKQDTNSYTVLPENKNSFNIQTQLFSDTLSRHINKFLHHIGVEFSPVSSIEVQIYGITPESVRRELVILPKMDEIIRFDSIVDVKSVLSALPESRNYFVDTVRQILSIKGISYYCQQLSQHEIYIGTSEPLLLHKKKNLPLALFRGNSSALLRVEGDKTLASLMQSVPQIQALQAFLGQINDFNIEFIEEGSNRFEVNGIISLSKEKIITVEIIQLFKNMGF